MQIIFSYANGKSSEHEVSKEVGQRVSDSLVNNRPVLAFEDAGGDRIFMYMNHIVQVRIKHDIHY